MADHIKHNRRTPRGFFSLFIRLGGWVALTGAAVLLVLTLISHFTERSADRFDREGVVANAIVVDREVVISRDSDGDTTRSYFLTLGYETAAGQQLRTREKVNRRTYDAGQRGKSVRLRYLESRPTRVEYPLGSSRATSWWTLIFAGLAGAATLLAVWIFGKEAAEAIRVRRHGQELLAEVTGIRTTTVEVNDVRQARLQWRDEDGGEGESLMRGLPELQAYEVGDIITVYRLGGDVWWMGDVGPRARN